MSEEDAALSPENPIGRWTNGLLAPSYVALTDVSLAMAPQLLTALERARIAAYLAQTANGAMLRLYVAAAERADARTIVASVLRALGGVGAPPDEQGDAEPAPPDPLDGIDTDAAFAALVADWHVDTHTAIRDAERDLSREDEDWRLRLSGAAPGTDDELTWLDDDHYVPPTPPPVPRPTAPVALAMVLIAISVFLLGFGDLLQLPFQLSLFLGVTGILTATGMLIMRLRTHRDEDDDGAVL